MPVAKRIEGLREQVDENKTYTLDEAVALVKQCATAKFDETVELHMKTGLDGRHADQQLRGSVILPNGVGKDVRVLVFAEGEAATAAEAAGADIVGSDDLIKQVQDQVVVKSQPAAVPNIAPDKTHPGFHLVDRSFYSLIARMLLLPHYLASRLSGGDDMHASLDQSEQTRHRVSSKRI